MFVIRCHLHNHHRNRLPFRHLHSANSLQIMLGYIWKKSIVQHFFLVFVNSYHSSWNESFDGENLVSAFHIWCSWEQISARICCFIRDIYGTSSIMLSSFVTLLIKFAGSGTLSTQKTYLIQEIAIHFVNYAMFAF